MFKVNNRNTKARCEICSKSVSLLSTLNYFTPCSSVSIGNFEQVNTGWVIFLRHVGNSLASYLVNFKNFRNLGRKDFKFFQRGLFQNLQMRNVNLGAIFIVDFRACPHVPCILSIINEAWNKKLMKQSTLSINPLSYYFRNEIAKGILSVVG